MHLKKLSRHLNRFRFNENSFKHLVSRCHAGTAAPGSTHPRRFPACMSAWQVTSFANGGKVELKEDVPVPIISHPHHVLVKVGYASVNPLDVEMIRGFGHTLLKSVRFLDTFCSQSNGSAYELPITLGRDFSGIVVATGSSVTKFNIGDAVFGVVKPEHNGCHAEYVLTSDSLILKKPETLSPAKASAILYTTLTAWSALRISGSMVFDFSTKYPALVIGASGGVGQAAVQLLKAWNCPVVATCRTDAIPVVQKSSPDIIVDYSSPDYFSQIEEACSGFIGKYFLILDAAGLSDNELLKYRDIVHEDGTIVTLRSPLLANIDQYGLLAGGLKSLTDLILSNISYGSSMYKVKLRWAYFTSISTAMNEVKGLVEDEKLNPEIEKMYPFSQADQAYSRMKAGHLRGKIIISLGERNS